MGIVRASDMSTIWLHMAATQPEISWKVFEFKNNLNSNYCTIILGTFPDLGSGYTLESTHPLSCLCTEKLSSNVTQPVYPALFYFRATIG